MPEPTHRYTAPPVVDTRPVRLFDWQRLVLASKHPTTVKCVALAVSVYADAAGAHARPGIDRLMVDCSTSRSTVKRAIRELVADGFLTRVQHGVGQHGAGLTDVFQLSVTTVSMGHR